VGINRRIQRLEELYGLDEDPQQKARMQDRRRAELRAKLDRIIARDGLANEEELDSSQRKAIDDFVESFRRRREQRGA
jgi:hypothetical protein